MANEVANQTSRNISDIYERYGEEMSRSEIVGRILKLSKIGTYTAGQDQDEIPKGTQMIADMYRLRTGWIKWEDNRPIERKMGYLQDYIPPPRDTLGDLDNSMWEDPERDPLQFVNDLVMYQPDSEEMFTSAATSRGGINAVGELSKHWGKHIRMHGEGTLPLIKLDVGFYMHSNRSFGKILYPKFVIVKHVKPPQALLDSREGGAPLIEEDELPLIQSKAPSKAPLKAVVSNKKTAKKGVRF